MFFDCERQNLTKSSGGEACLVKETEKEKA